MKKIAIVLPMMMGLLTTTVGEAAQVGQLQSYEQNIVTNTKTKLYRNSQLQQSTTINKGKVYKANGYRLINGQKYYRVYQNQYKGYVKASATQTLKAQPVNSSYFVNTKKTYNIWGNLYFNKVNGQTTLNQVTYVKYRYDLPNGSSYFSLYNQDNKKQWLGYANANAFAKVKAIQLPQMITLNVKPNFNIYRSLNGGTPVATTNQYQNQLVYAKYRYDFVGRYIYSIYRNDGSWIGYIETYGTYQTINASQQKQLNYLIQKAEELYREATPAQKQQDVYQWLYKSLLKAKTVNETTSVSDWYEISMELSGRIENVINS